VHQWYVRHTDRYVEILGRRSPEHGKGAGLLRPKGSELSWSATELATDFATDLTIVEFEPYTLWTVQDEPPSS
jgi:hypothetical protein